MYPPPNSMSGVIDLRRGGFFQAGEVHVANDTDNGAPSSMVILSADAATDGIATRKILSGEGFVHDGRVARVVVGKGSPCDQRNVHCREIAGRGKPPLRQLVFLVGIPINPENA